MKIPKIELAENELQELGGVNEPSKSKQGAVEKQKEVNHASAFGSTKNNNENETTNNAKALKSQNKGLENGDGAHKVKSAAQKGGFVGTGGSNLRGASASMREPKQNSAPAHLKSAKNRPSAQGASSNKSSTVTPTAEQRAAQVESSSPPSKRKKTSSSQGEVAGSNLENKKSEKSGASASPNSAQNSGSAGGGPQVPPKAKNKTSVTGKEALNAAQVAANGSSAPKATDGNADSKKKVATKDAETITEAEILAPCETGTEVHLSGIIWHETDGMVVVNVTWRNRSYIGTLLDSSKHDWAPPRLGIDGETDDGTKPGRRKGRQKPVKNSRNSRPGENGTAPVAGRKNKREPEPNSDTDNGKPGPKKPRTTNGRGTPVHENSEKEKSEAEGSSAVQSLACHFKDCHKKFKKQEALQYHIDEHRRKTAETEKEQKKKDKKENQENSKGDKSDNEINAALGLAALGQLSDQKDGGTGPPSLTKGSKGRPQSVENVVAPPPPLLQKQPTSSQASSLPPMPVLTPKPGLSLGNNAPSPIPRRPNQLSPSLDESGLEMINGTTAATDSTSPKTTEPTSTIAPSVISSVVQSDPNVPISVPTAQNAVPSTSLVIDPSRSQVSPTTIGAAEIPPKLERRPTSPFQPVKPENESPSQCARVSPSAYSDISDPGDEAPPQSPQNAKAKDEKIPKVQEEMTSVLYSNYPVSNPSMKSHLLINRDEKKDDSRKLASKNDGKIVETEKAEQRHSALGPRPKSHQTDGNKPTATIQPTKQETKPLPAKSGKDKHSVSSPGAMPLSAYAQMPYAPNEYMPRQYHHVPAIPGFSVVPTTVAHYSFPLTGLPTTPFQPPVAKPRLETKSGLARDPARPGSPLKPHGVHPHMTYTSPGLLPQGHHGLPSYGYGPLHPSTTKK
ncbi:Oidioi.mRNA.OKI2018_I69.XSR.g15655.t1.cds [Oikopleura dioica]|uniref:Oidioi.mRNA.OKI2018_I69.XSR.g15655.t1.cds n=1 Tax=Oikopleura dioica TaxID=34765 RepID=A0ABN7SDI2_OIKDI|nr:Oidioi.mRNA.OKI2018_I69.XSR.g15655.t1.cds [Oikopleura dioica]